MRKEFPTLWILQFLVLLIMGTLSLFTPDFILQYSRGMKQPEELAKPVDELHQWVLGIKSMPVPDKDVQDFFRRMARAESAALGDEEFRLDGFWAKNAAGASHAHPDHASPKDEWTHVKRWILSCKPQLENKAAWNKITAWIHATDEFPDPPEQLLAWVKNAGSTTRGPTQPDQEESAEDSQPLAALRHLVLEAKPTQIISWSISANYVRQSAPAILAAALFTLFGMLSGSIRRPLARIFVLIFLFWTVGILWGRLDNEFSLQHIILFGGLFAGVTLLGTLLKQCPAKSSSRVIWFLLTVWWARVGILEICRDYDMNAPSDGSLFLPGCLTVSIITVSFLGIINAWYWLIGENEDPPQDDAGIAQGRPPQLWTIWMIQFVLLTFVGLFTLTLPHVSAHIFTQSAVDHLNTGIVDHSVRMLGVWVLALALLSYFALGSARDWIWQGISWIFIVAFATFAVSASLNLNTDEYTRWAYLYGFQGLFFIPATLKQLYREDPWSTENIESDVFDWQWGDLMIGLPMMLRPLLVGRRTLYRQGVGAGGVFRMKPLSPADFSAPELKGVASNEFFSQDKEFPVQLRFSNRTQDDDTGLDIRGCAMRLSVGSDSPLDILFATGSFSPIRSLKDAWHMLPLDNHILPFYRLERRIEKNKTLREGLVAGLRRAPKSFTCLTYYNQLVLEWRVPDGNHYLVRFRLVPTSDKATTDEDKGLTCFEDLNSLRDQSR